MPFTSTGGIDATNTNPPGAAASYQSFLTAGSIIAPPGVLQISGFAYDDEQEDTVVLANDITDHWVEDNTAVQDHIGVRPVIVALKGRISELAFSVTTQGAILSALAAVENTLTQVPAYIGTYTPGVEQTLLTAITQAQNISYQIEEGAARLQQLANFFPASGPQRNKQQTAFATLSALANARVLFTINTPFQVFFNMAIQSINATQPTGTSTVSNFNVSMKQIQFTNSISQASFLSQYGGRAAAGYQPPTANGLTAGVSVVTSVITAAF